MIIDTYRNLKQRFDLSARFSLPSFWEDDVIGLDREVLLVDGSLQLQQDLLLDWGKLEALLPEKRPNPLAALIVLGDLVIDGSLLNTSIDDGPTLLVAGNLVAHNLVSGGAQIMINRDANIRDVVFANYNHGELCVEATLHTALLYMCDHCFGAREVSARLEITEKLSYEYEFDDDDDDDEIETELESDELRALRSMLSIPADDVEAIADDILNALCAGRDVLKAEARNLVKIAPARFCQSREDVIAYVRQSKFVRSNAIPRALHQDRAFMLELTALHPDVYACLGTPWYLEADFLHAGLDAGSTRVADYIRHVEDPAARRALEARIEASQPTRG